MSAYLDGLKKTYKHITSTANNEIRWAKIYKFTSEGFKAKVQRVKGIITFDMMPWTYQNEKHWDIVAPYLIEKTYTSQIIASDDAKMLLNLSVKEHSFTSKKYTRGQSYKCVILEKENDTILVDAGLDSSFKHGSQYGQVVLSNFWDHSDYGQLAIGQEIILCFLDHHEDGVLSMCQPSKYTHWYKHKPHNLIGNTVPVTVHKEGLAIVLKVYSHFDSELHMNNILHENVSMQQLEFYFQNLKDREVISCIVSDINNSTNQLSLLLTPEVLTELASQNV
jgi:hypothetical protein